MLKALIFDVDGTLAETERDGHRLAFNQAFAEVGLDWYWSEEIYGKLLEVGGGKERIAYYLQQLQEVQEVQELPRLVDFERLQDWIGDLHRRKSYHYVTVLHQGVIRPRLGVLRLLQEAKAQGILLTIATTSTLPNVLSLLQTTIASDSPDWFQVIAAGDIVSHKKPAPDIYHYVLRQLKLDPESCLAIEDSHAGLTAAKGAGLRTIVTVNGYTEHQDFSAADLVINHLGEPDFPLQICSNPHHYQPDDSLDFTQVSVGLLKDFLNFLNTLRASSADE